MGSIEIGITLLWLFASFVFAAGYAGASVTPADFRKARVCFYLSALLVAAGIIVWGVTTAQPLLMRALIVGCAGAAILWGLTEVLRWVAIREGMVEGATHAPSDPSSPSGTAAYRSLKGLSNLQLKDATLELTGRIRIFEANSGWARFPNVSAAPTASLEEKRAQWDARTAEMMDKMKQIQAEFGNQFLGQSREMRDEITFRLRAIGILPPYVELNRFTSRGAETIDHGFLAGPMPMSIVGDYLEALARRLPL